MDNVLALRRAVNTTKLELEARVVAENDKFEPVTSKLSLNFAVDVNVTVSSYPITERLAELAGGSGSSIAAKFLVRTFC